MLFLSPFRIVLRKQQNFKVRLNQCIIPYEKHYQNVMKKSENIPTMLLFQILLCITYNIIGICLTKYVNVAAQFFLRDASGGSEVGGGEREISPEVLRGEHGHSH